jgi:uncharacterized small protein (TIGR04563 family)
MPKEPADARKQSIYVPNKMLADMREQAARLDRSMSWCIQYAWGHGRMALIALPDHEMAPGEPIR